MDLVVKEKMKKELKMNLFQLAEIAVSSYLVRKGKKTKNAHSKNTTKHVNQNEEI
jgi:hypothetical protein